MSDLIERYVSAVGRRLPRGQRGDVETELYSTLLDELEGVERLEDGSPRERDAVELLRRFGPPHKVAASYRPAGAYLIGPELYPSFLTTLKIVPTVLGAVIVVGFLIGLLTSPADGAGLGGRLLGLLGGTIDAAITAVGVIVLIFALLQRAGVTAEASDEEWEPRDLPPVVAPRDAVGRGEALFGLVASAAFLALANLFKDVIGAVVFPDGRLLLNDVFVAHLPWINVALLVSMATHLVTLLEGRWRWHSRLLDLGGDAFSIFVLYKIARAVAAERQTLVEAGLSEPVPSILVGSAFAVVLVVAGFAIVNAVKILHGAISGGARRPAWAAPPENR